MIQVSVIIRAKQWSESLRLSLEMLSRQTIGVLEFEVLISTLTPEELEASLKRLALPYRCQVVRQETAEAGGELHRLAHAASGDFCLFLKENQIATPGMLAEHMQAQEKLGGICGIGRVIFNPRGSGWLTTEYCLWKNNHTDGLVGGDHPVNWKDCLDFNFSVPRQAILELATRSLTLEGGWGSDGAEIELAYMLARSGLTCAYIPEAVCSCEVSLGLSDYVKETIVRGSVYVQLWQQQPSMLPELLGNFFDMSLRALILRRILLWLSVKPRLLARLVTRLPHHAWSSEWFVFLHSYCFWYGVKQALTDRSTWRRLTYGTPILMYHAFDDTGEQASHYVVPQRRFTQQMALLKFLGYRVISLEAYLDCLTSQSLVVERSLVITIDDGYLDNYQIAFPVLQRFGFTATIFLVSDGLGGTNLWDEGGKLTGRQRMNASQAREMHAAGIAMGSHTCTHPTLTKISPQRSWEEISRSKADLERELGVPIRTFAYPHGLYNSVTVDQLIQAGYQGACCVETGLNTPASPIFALHRTDVRGTTSLLQFLKLLWSGLPYGSRVR